MCSNDSCGATFWKELWNSSSLDFLPWPIKPKMEKEFYERSCCFLISTDSCQWCACHFMSQIFNMPMFLIFLFRRLGVDGCASQPPSRLLLCLGFAVCYATFCLGYVASHWLVTSDSRMLPSCSFLDWLLYWSRAQNRILWWHCHWHCWFMTGLGLCCTDTATALVIVDAEYVSFTLYTVHCTLISDDMLICCWWYTAVQ